MRKHFIFFVGFEVEKMKELTTGAINFDSSFQLSCSSVFQEVKRYLSQKSPDVIIIRAKELETASKELIELCEDIGMLVVLDENDSFEKLSWITNRGGVGYVNQPFSNNEFWIRVKTLLYSNQLYRSILGQKEEILHKNQLLEIQKNNELIAKTMELDRKNNVLLKIREKLEMLPPNTDEIIRNSRREMMALVKTAVNNKQNFLTYFEKIHPGFFSYLNRKYSRLTVEDMKYCAYIKMQMSNWEISILQNINQESVRTHKYRLKKKMGLSKEIDFQKYINEIKAEFEG